jgi:hypothetical protein
MPSASHCDTADQEIDSGSSNASTPALVAPVGGLFEVLGAESLVRKCSQLVAQFFELRRLSDTGEQLLADWPNEPGETVLNQFVQRSDWFALGFAEPASVSSQS